MRFFSLFNFQESIKLWKNRVENKSLFRCKEIFSSQDVASTLAILKIDKNKLKKKSFLLSKRRDKKKKKGENEQKYLAHRTFSSASS